MVETTFKNKINGNVFVVTEAFKVGKKEYYGVLDMQSGQMLAVGKAAFANAWLPYLEIIERK